MESNQAAVDRGIGMIKSSLDVIAKKAVTKEGVAEAVAKVCVCECVCVYMCECVCVYV